MARRPRSTASFISYDLRPAKQSERRILMDVLKLAGDCGLPVSDYQYVGMGANRFYDFLLIHKYLGIGKMVSLEHDPVMYNRALFNCPYSFIQVENQNSATYLAASSAEEPAIYWFDYDGGIGPSILQDIATFGTKLKQGDFCFVTVFGGPPGVVDRVNDGERLAWLQDNLGPMSVDVVLDDVERSSFPIAVHKILLTAFKNAFAARRDGRFFPFLQVEYADSMPMITVGGGFLTDGQIAPLKAKIKNVMPFLINKDPVLYEIKSLHLTERERALFDRATTSPNNRSSERRQIKALGFRDAEISAYKDLLRYFPRYVETMV